MQCARTMHVVLIGWLFVIALMALALASPVAGVAWFVGAGLVPTLLVAWLYARSRRRRLSMLEQEMHAGDDADPQADR
jgi:Flp pilus assembly protein TadB